MSTELAREVEQVQPTEEATRRDGDDAHRWVSPRHGRDQLYAVAVRHQDFGDQNIGRFGQDTL
nr:hypothetical protein [Phenylobacterium sp.]